MKKNYKTIFVFFIFFIHLAFAAGSENQPDDRVVGYQFLDSGDVLHLWNEHYDYYYDVDTAIQLTNHYDEYWTENVFCLGYKGLIKEEVQIDELERGTNGQNREQALLEDEPQRKKPTAISANVDKWSEWDRKCTDDLDMDYEIESDDETFVRLTYSTIREFEDNVVEYVIEYYLESGDKDINVKVHIKNLKGEPVDRDLGFTWKVREIKVGNLYDNNEINVGWQDFYMLDENLDLSYTNGDLPATEFLLKREDEWLRIKWDDSLPWQLRIKSRNNQINAPVSLDLNLGSLAENGEVSTDLRWIDALCKGDWGDDSSPYPVDGDDTKFSDSDTVDLNCHLIGDQCPSSPVVGQCGGPGDQGFMSCRIQVRDGSGTWNTIATSTNGDNCDFDDDSGSNFASLSNYMIDHDDKTDIRCKAIHVYWHASNEICAEENKGHTKSDDWWFNANTPNAINVVINDSNSSNVSNVTVLDDLDCDYGFDDSDNDSENVSAAVFVWYVNDVDIGVNNQMLDSSYTNVGDDVICSVKVFDDVFSTGNEVFVNSSNVSVFGIPDQPGTLRSMNSFSESAESSFVFSGRNRILELKGDGSKLYRHHDVVGSTSLATDEVGSVKEEVVYLPFGGKKFENNFDTFYTGKELDSSGLMYFGSRYYDSASGRFTQVDPVLRDSQSNYHYAMNSPLKYIDPDGNHPIADVTVWFAKRWEIVWGKRDSLVSLKQGMIDYYSVDENKYHPGGLGSAGPFIANLMPESAGGLIYELASFAGGGAALQTGTKAVKGVNVARSAVERTDKVTEVVKSAGKPTPPKKIKSSVVSKGEPGGRTGEYPSRDQYGRTIHDSYQPKKPVVEEPEPKEYMDTIGEYDDSFREADEYSVFDNIRDTSYESFFGRSQMRGDERLLTEIDEFNSLDPYDRSYYEIDHLEDLGFDIRRHLDMD